MTDSRTRHSQTNPAEALPEEIRQELQGQFIAISSPIQWSLFPLIVLVVAVLERDTETLPLAIWTGIALLDWMWVMTNNYLNRRCLQRNEYPPGYELRNIINSFCFGLVWGCLPLVTIFFGTLSSTVLPLALVPGMLSVLILELSSTRKLFYWLLVPLSVIPFSTMLFMPPPLFYIGIIGVIYIVVIFISHNIFYQKQFERIHLALKTTSRIALLAKAIEQYDSLTGLFNVVGLKSWLAKVGSDRKIRVLLGNVHGFREINFLYGSTLADNMMKELALRMRINAEEDLGLARLSGAEFLVVDSGRNSRKEKLRFLFDNLQLEPIRIGDNDVNVTINHVLLEGTAGDLDQLVSIAQDILRARMNRHDHQESALRMQLEKRRQLAFEFVEALEAGRIQPWFQPIVNCKTNQIVRWEALARWDHPDLGIVPPESFLDIARISGQSTMLTRMMLRESVDFVHTLQERGLTHLAFVSVNFRVSELMDPGSLDWIEPLLKERPLQPSQVAIEVSEKEALIVDEQLEQNLRHLQNLGIEIIIDDFGTGFSNLGHLLDLKPSSVKLDKRFIMKLPEDRNSAALLRAVLTMANELCIVTVAEGVEKEEQLTFLRECGCIAYQGWLAGEAIPLQQALALAENWQADGSHATATGS
jgi:EAL domain-containing protein (putative c-di-GMP-specific phosphodiesterase class I)